MKSIKSLLLLSVSLIILLAIAVTSCSKSSVSTTGNKKLSVYLTDDPGIQFQSVSIDIKYVEVKLDTTEAHHNDDHFGDNDHDGDDDHHHSDAFGHWDTLAITAGVYDVATLRNGIDALLATGTVNGEIRKIRITLGNNSTVTVAGTTYPLNLLPGSNNYLYVKIHKEDQDEQGDHQNDIDGVPTRLWIDFDISRSIVLSAGQYYLKPMLRPFCDKNFGEIEGKVFPAEANPIVKVFNTTDTVTAIPEHEGQYKVRGLQAGTYSVLFQGFNGYKDTTITNVVVTNDNDLHLANVTLVK